MGTVTYRVADGTEQVIEVMDGSSLMEAAVQNGVPGIDADCWGACACATCHVYVDENWYDKVGKPESMENAMLELACERRPTSRLSCQITMTEYLDGLVVEIPEQQGVEY